HQLFKIDEDEVERLGHLHGQRGVHNIRRGQPHVEEPMLRPYRFRERFEKGDHVVLRHLLDSGDTLYINPGFLPNTSRGTARDLSGSFERLAGGQLDCEPDLVLAFQFPDGFHLGTGVAINHLFSVSRMLKMSASGVLASLPRTVKQGSVSKLRPCLGYGASLGEEAVLAGSGGAGEVAARVGRVRSLAFLSILCSVPLSSQTCRPVKIRRSHRVFPQPVRREGLGVRGGRGSSVFIRIISPHVPRLTPHVFWRPASIPCSRPDPECRSRTSTRRRRRNSSPIRWPRSPSPWPARHPSTAVHKRR